MSEYPSTEDRLTKIELWKSGLDSTFRAWIIFMTVVMGCFGWYLKYQLENFDGNRLDVATLVSSVQILTGTVTDNKIQIRDMGKEIRELQLSNQLLNVKINSIPGKVNP